MNLLAITLILLSPSQADAEASSLPEQLYRADRAFIEAVDARDEEAARAALQRLAELGSITASPSGQHKELDLGADIERARSAGLELQIDASDRSDMPWRGRRGGPSQARHHLEQGERLTEEAVYVGGELAAVYARAATPIPVRLVIMSMQGERICDETSSQGRALCTWTPPEDQLVRIEVTADGSDSAELRLFSN